MTTHRYRLGALITGSAIALGVTTLPAPAAHADPIQVKPGLSCDDFYGVINCTNTTDTDYTVTEKRACAEGDYTDTSYENSKPHTTDHHADAEVKYTNVFVPAHNTAMGYLGCDTHADTVTFSIAPPAAPAPS
jgi:hypothetical protein